jgi:hypothetical protein
MGLNKSKVVLRPNLFWTMKRRPIVKIPKIKTNNKGEIPILFSTPMILKILSGEKNVTRRIVKPQPPDYIDYFEFVEADFECYHIKHPTVFRPFGILGVRSTYPDIKAKYTPGDRLWVRETWGINGYNNESAYEINAIYKADNFTNISIDLDNEELWERIIKQEEYYRKKLFEQKKEFIPKWRPSIFLPRLAARIFLEIKTARIERLHKLDDIEAQREGFKNREEFIKFWDTKNRKGRGYPWEVNPWVYRIKYGKI